MTACSWQGMADLPACLRYKTLCIMPVCVYKQNNALVVDTMLLDLVSSEHAVLLQIYIDSAPVRLEALCLLYLKGLL